MLFIWMLSLIIFLGSLGALGWRLNRRKDLIELGLGLLICISLVAVLAAAYEMKVAASDAFWSHRVGSVLKLIQAGLNKPNNLNVREALDKHLTPDTKINYDELEELLRTLSKETNSFGPRALE